MASELPGFVKEAVALGFGRKLSETTTRRCQRAAAALWVDARAREELIAPTCLFAMEYLRYLAEVSESWDETKEHESQTTREEELIRETSSVAFVALCSARPGERCWQHGTRDRSGYFRRNGSSRPLATADDGRDG